MEWWAKLLGKCSESEKQVHQDEALCCSFVQQNSPKLNVCFIPQIWRGASWRRSAPLITSCQKCGPVRMKRRDSCSGGQHLWPTKPDLCRRLRKRIPLLSQANRGLPRTVPHQDLLPEVRNQSGRTKVGPSKVRMEESRNQLVWAVLNSLAAC